MLCREIFRLEREKHPKWKLAEYLPVCILVEEAEILELENLIGFVLEYLVGGVVGILEVADELVAQDRRTRPAFIDISLQVGSALGAGG